MNAMDDRMSEIEHVDEVLSRLQPFDLVVVIMVMRGATMADILDVVNNPPVVLADRRRFVFRCARFNRRKLSWQMNQTELSNLLSRVRQTAAIISGESKQMAMLEVLAPERR